MNNPLIYTDPSGYINMSLDFATAYYFLMHSPHGGTWSSGGATHAFSASEAMEYVDEHNVWEETSFSINITHGGSSNFYNRKGGVDKKWPFGFISSPSINISSEKTGRLILGERNGNSFNQMSTSIESVFGTTSENMNWGDWGPHPGHTGATNGGVFRIDYGNSTEQERLIHFLDGIDYLKDQFNKTGQYKPYNVNDWFFNVTQPQGSTHTSFEGNITIEENTFNVFVTDFPATKDNSQFNWFNQGPNDGFPRIIGGKSYANYTLYKFPGSNYPLVNIRVPYIFSDLFYARYFK